MRIEDHYFQEAGDLLSPEEDRMLLDRMAAVDQAMARASDRSRFDQMLEDCEALVRKW